MENNDYVMMYSVDAVCDNCGDAHEAQIPEGLPLTEVACSKCKCCTLRRALPHEKKDSKRLGVSLKHLRLLTACDNCGRVGEALVPEDMPLERVACLGCGEAKLRRIG